MSERFNLEATQAKHLPRLAWTEILKITEGTESLDEKHTNALAEYFSHFVRQDENRCPGCEKTLTGDLVKQLVGEATFTWGIVHGEGFCRGCGYPARAYHRVENLIDRLALVLAYHPDELKKHDLREVEVTGGSQTD